MTSISRERTGSIRFGLGGNWARYLALMDGARIAAARQSGARPGKSFLTPVTAAICFLCRHGFWEPASDSLTEISEQRDCHYGCNQLIFHRLPKGA